MRAHSVYLGSASSWQPDKQCWGTPRDCRARPPPQGRHRINYRVQSFSNGVTGSTECRRGDMSRVRSMRSLRVNQKKGVNQCKTRDGQQ